MFKQLISVAYVPDLWKQAVVTPVHKKGPANVLTNYRPISVTCVACKLLERIVVQKIYAHLSYYGALSGDQHGFMRGRSTCTNLLECLNDVTLNMQDKCQTIVIYIDFSKAFDVVPHDKLFIKLHAYGIRGVLLQWLKNLFSGRTFCTKINNLLSAIAQLVSGVIQGSAVGPLMFLIYINDLVSLLTQYGIRVKLFADDVKLYIKIVNHVDSYKLQQALSALCKWASEWQLGVSVDKCCVMSIGKGDITDQFCINGVQLPVVSTYRDLGIIISNDLSPSAHINDIVFKAHQRANLIFRCFVSHNTHLLLRAFVTYVRPLLEYNCIIWSPSHKCDIDLIEQVQRRFTKRLKGFRHYPYEKRLQLLNIPKLETRRLQQDLIWCYKILFGHVSVNRDTFFELRVSATRGHPYKLYKHFNSSTVRCTFFADRVVNTWNKLPHPGVDFNSLNSFKRTLKNVDLTVL